MPLKKGSSKEVIQANIDELIAAGHSREQAAAIAYKEAGAAMDESARKFDDFGWMTIEDNPISKVGVFPYLGSQIGADDKSKIYMVLRPQEELNDPETIESFKLTPFINEHPENLLGNIGSLVKTDNKRVEGVIGEKVYFEFPYLRANLRVYSAQTLDSIEIGKEQVSAGYSCKWSKESGVFGGQAYEYVQRRIRGNHSALVVEGRSGPDVSVMDSMTFKLESKEQQMKLEDLAESVAALTAKMDKIQGAMDEAEKKAEAKDEEEKNAKEDAEKKAMDDAEEEAEAERKKAEEDKAKEGAKDEDEDKKDDDKKDEKKDAMDSASFKRAVAAQVAAEVAKQMAKQPAAMDSATIMAEIAKKTDLASRVSHFIGSFAHDSMSLKQVAEYAAEKLGMPKDNAEIRVESYLAGRPSPSQAYGMDSIDVQKSTGAAYLATHVK